MEKLVSIIVPAYNVAPYIAQCLDSLIGQSYKNIEIIVINDGSTDDTASIIKFYEKKDSRIKVVNKKNGGLASARNAGLAVIHGEYVAFLDSDDVMMPDRIMQQTEWLEAHDECLVVYSNLLHFFDNTTKTYYLRIASLGNDQYVSLLKGNSINPNTVCMRKTVYEIVGGFDETLRSAEDWEYWLRITHLNMRIGYMNNVVTLYRIRRNSLSADSVTMCNTALSVLEKQTTDDMSPTHRTLLALEKSAWKMKLKIARMQKRAPETTGLVGYFYTIFTYITRRVRGVKLWLRLKKVKHPSAEFLLLPYVK